MNKYKTASIKKTILFSVLSVVMLLSACTSATRITSEPPGATVYINGALKGETPYLYPDSKILLSKTPVTLKKDGYEPFIPY